ncbi:PilZ domain-containing protein [Undibacterium sp.]|uniref:PilZ domain-containing protein n=1 Tax=Undibacterium sp. TaxID=1914977 RepID=UPI0037534112
MIELRRSPRINVTWRGMIKVAEGNILQIRAINVSATGILILSPQSLMIDREYHCMLEVPQIDVGSSQPYKVQCKIAILHSILSGDAFRVGVRFVDISELHQDLLNAWVSLVSKQDPPKDT